MPNQITTNLFLTEIDVLSKEINKANKNLIKLAKKYYDDSTKNKDKIGQQITGERSALTLKIERLNKLVSRSIALV